MQQHYYIYAGLAVVAAITLYVKGYFGLPSRQADRNSRPPADLGNAYFEAMRLRAEAANRLAIQQEFDKLIQERFSAPFAAPASVPPAAPAPPA